LKNARNAYYCWHSMWLAQFCKGGNYMLKPDLLALSTTFYLHNNFVISKKWGDGGNDLYLIMKMLNLKFKFSSPLLISWKASCRAFKRKKMQMRIIIFD